MGKEKIEEVKNKEICSRAGGEMNNRHRIVGFYAGVLNE